MFIFKVLVIIFIVYASLLLPNLITEPYNRTRCDLIMIVGIPLSYFAWQIASPWTIYAIPKVLLFMSVVLIITGSTFKYQFEAIIVAFLLGSITIFAYIICGVIYWLNIETSNEAYINTQTRYITEKVEKEGKSGKIFSQEGSILQGYRYKYYYKAENGEILEGKLPAETTSIFAIEDDKKPYIEKVENVLSTTINRNDDPPTFKKKNVKVSYNVYLPKKYSEGFIISKPEN